MNLHTTETRDPTRWSTAGDVLIRSLVPILLALMLGGVIIWALGVNPLEFYRDVIAFGLGGNGWQRSLTAMAPLLMIALGLIVAFRARLWNLSYNGAYLLAAAVVAGIAPDLFARLPYALALVIVCAAAIGTGFLVGFLPAWLKARRGTNEIVTSLMMSFIALGVANLLVKGPFQDREVQVPQTRVLDQAMMLPYLPGTRVHVGVVIALFLVLIAQLVLTRTAFGLEVDVLGASPKAAAHAGIDVPRLVMILFLISTGLIALAGAIDQLGLWGHLRTNWNPAYGDKILPFVFLARLSPLASVPLVGLYAVLATGGTIAAQRVGLSVDFLLVIIALMLFFMTVIELLGRRRDLGRSYLHGHRPASMTDQCGGEVSNP